MFTNTVFSVIKNTSLIGLWPSKTECKVYAALSILLLQSSALAQQLYPYSLPYLSQGVSQSDGIFNIFNSSFLIGDSRIIVSATSFSDGEITADEFYGVVFDVDGLCVSNKIELCGEVNTLDTALVTSIDHVSITLAGAKGFLGGGFSLKAVPIAFPTITIELNVNFSESFSGGTFTATTSNNSGSVSGTGYSHVYFDADFDGRTDVYENCAVHQNPDQNDSDNDGLGNACDPDFNNDCQVDYLDFALFVQAYGSQQERYDLNDDNIVNFLDFDIVTEFFGEPPGPSGSLSPNICWEE